MTTTLTFLPCVFASMTVSITIIDDIIAESTECFEVGLVAGAVSGPRVEFGEVANACVRILDDDGKHFNLCEFLYARLLLTTLSTQASLLTYSTHKTWKQVKYSGTSLKGHSEIRTPLY